MREFSFRGLQGERVSPQVWLRIWSERFPSDKYPGYDTLIQRRGDLRAEHFILVGRWKDAAQSDAKWKPNVASVAYDIWMQAASGLPRWPDDAAAFLTAWKERRYVNSFANRMTSTRFGLSRATTLLHFLSGGE